MQHASRENLKCRGRARWPSLELNLIKYVHGELPFLLWITFIAANDDFLVTNTEEQFQIHKTLLSLKAPLDPGLEALYFTLPDADSLYFSLLGLCLSMNYQEFVALVFQMKWFCRAPPQNYMLIQLRYSYKSHVLCVSRNLLSRPWLVRGELWCNKVMKGAWCRIEFLERFKGLSLV